MKQSEDGRLRHVPSKGIKMTNRTKEYISVGIPEEEDDFLQVGTPHEDDEEFATIAVPEPDFSIQIPPEEQVNTLEQRQKVQEWVSRLNEKAKELSRDHAYGQDFPQLPDPAEVSEVLVNAQVDRKKKLKMLQMVRQKEQEIRDWLKTTNIPENRHEQETERRLRKIVERDLGYGWEGLDKAGARLLEDKKEIFSARSDYHGLMGSEEYWSPLQLLGSLFANPTEPSKWDGDVKNPREELERKLKSPIVRRDGSIDIQAVFTSDMPREWQNQLMAYEMSRQTQLPTQVWTDIISSKLADMPGKAPLGGAIRRILQIGDAFTINFASSKWPGGFEDKIEALKKLPPPFLVRVNKNEEGDWIFDMPNSLAHGREADFEGKEPYSEAGQQRLWADFIAYAADFAENETVSSLADVISMGIEGVLALIPPASPIGAAALAKRAGTTGAKAANIAKKSARASKLRHVTKAVSHIPRVMQGNYPIISTIGKMTPFGKRMAYKAIRRAPKTTGALLAADRLATVAATHAYLAAGGAGEKTAKDTAIMAATMSVPLSIIPAVRDSFQYQALNKFPKAYKEIMRKKNFNDLSDFSKNLVGRYRRTADEPITEAWDRIKQDTRKFIKVSDDLLEAVRRLDLGAENTQRHIPEFVDAIASSKEFREMIDELSRYSTETGMGVVGAHNYQVVQDTLDRLYEAGRAIAASPDAVRTKALGTASPYAVPKAVAKRAKEAIEEVPVDLWDKPEKLYAFMSEHKRLKKVSDELQIALEEAGAATDLVYHIKASEMLQAGIILHGAAEKGVTDGRRLLKEYVNMLANPGQELDIWLTKGKGALQTKPILNLVERTDLRDTIARRFSVVQENLPKIDIQQTVKGMLSEGPEAIQEVLDMARTILDDYAEAGAVHRTGGTGKSATEWTQIGRRTQRAIKQREREFKRQTTMDIEEINQKSDRATRSLEATANKVEKLETDMLQKADAAGVSSEDLALLREELRLRAADREERLSSRIPALLKYSTRADTPKVNLSDYPKDLIKTIRAHMRESARWRDKANEVMDWNQRLQELKGGEVSQSLDAIRAVYKFSGVEGFGDWKALGLDVLGVLDETKYWRSLAAKIAHEAMTGIELRGIPSIRLNTFKAIRALEDAQFVRAISKGRLSEAQVRKVQNESKMLATVLHRQTETAKFMRDKARRIEYNLRLITDNKARRTEALQQFRQIRDAYGGIYNLQRFMKKWEPRVKQAIENMTNKGNLSVTDMKSLYKLANSNAMALYRLRKPETRWVVTLQQEVDSLIAGIEKVGGEAFKRFHELAKKRFPEMDNIDTALLAGRFLGMTRDYDDSGWLGIASMAGAYYRRNDLVFEDVDSTVLREMLTTNSNVLKYLSRETATGVDRTAGAYFAAIQMADIRVQRDILDGYLNDLDKIPGYRNNPYGRDLNILMQKFAGYSKNFEWPIIDAANTEFGDILWRVVYDGEDPAKIFKKLRAEAEQLSETKMVGEGPYRGKLTEKGARMAELEHWAESIMFYWLPDTPKDKDLWRIGFEIQRTTQKWDRKSIEVFNKLNDELNERWGTNYQGMQYNPYRLDSNVRQDVENSIQVAGMHMPTMATMATQQRGGTFDLLTSRQMLGRTLESGQYGQKRKIENLSRAEVDDVRNNFLMSRRLLFQYGYTRKAMTDLRDLGIKLKDQGYERLANAVARSVLRHYVSLTPVEGVRKLWHAYADNGGPLRQYVTVPVRVMGAGLNPYAMLSTLYKTAVDNPVQTWIMQAGSAPQTMYRTPIDAINFFTRYPLRMMSPTLNWRKLHKIGGDLPPNVRQNKVKFVNARAREIRHEFAIRQQRMETPRAERQRMLIDWNVGPNAKRVYWWSGILGQDYLTEVAYRRLKENSEILMTDIAAGRASRAYMNAIEEADRLKNASREARLDAVRKELAFPIKATIESADITEAAINLIRDFDNNAPFKNMEGYLFLNEDVHISRFDPHNIPLLIASIDQVIPGFGAFFNAIYNYSYRAIHMGSSLVSKNKSEAGIFTLMGMMAWVGWSQFLSSLQDTSDDGTAGLGPMPFINRYDPFEVIKDFGVSSVKSPSIRAGGMEARYAVEAVWRIANLASATAGLSKDYHVDKMYDATEEFEEELLNVAGLIEKATPAVILRELIGSPSAVGLYYFAIDPENAQAKILNIMQNDKIIQHYTTKDIEGNYASEMFSPEQELGVSAADTAFDLMSAVTNFIPLTMRYEQDDIMPMSAERFSKHQYAFRLALGKLGIGPENKLLWFFATENYKRIQEVTQEFRAMKEEGERVFPVEVE